MQPLDRPATMPRPEIRIGDVRLFLQSPDPIPDPYPYLDYSGVVDRIVDALREGADGPSPLSVCLTGPSGVGKTSAAWAAARMLGLDCYTTQGSTDCSAQDLVVFPVPTDLGRFDPVASGICTACLEGGIGLLDEIGKVARFAPEALTPLASLLDERRTLWSDFLKMPFPVRPGFGFICTTQDNEPLPDYITQRMLTFRIPPPETGVLVEIVRRKVPGVSGMLAEAFRAWAADRPALTPRDGGLILHFASRRKRLGALRELGAREADRLIRDAASAVRPQGEAP